MIQRANKNLSSRSKQLISLLGCLGSRNVIIIPTQALANVRLIPTAAADTIIKAPGFLCSEPCTDEAHKVCFGGKTKHELYFFLNSSPSCLLPCGDQREAARMSRMQLDTEPEPRACGRGSRMLMAAGCCPGTSQGAVYLGALPSRRPPALEVQKPAFAGTPGRDPSVRSTLPLTQIMRPKYKPR